MLGERDLDLQDIFGGSLTGDRFNLAIELRPRETEGRCQEGIIDSAIGDLLSYGISNFGQEHLVIGSDGWHLLIVNIFFRLRRYILHL